MKTDNYLQLLIDTVVLNSPFSENVGLFDGKLGNAVLLHHYARHASDDTITKLANTLLDDIVDKLTYQSEKEVVEFALGINNLIQHGFIDADDDIFDDVDDWLFNKLNYQELRIWDIPVKALLGIYIYHRLDKSPPLNRSIWLERMQKNLLLIDTIFAQRLFSQVMHVFTCNDLLPLAFLCSKLEGEPTLSHVIKAIRQNMENYVSMAFKESRSEADKFHLSLYLREWCLEQCATDSDTISTVTLTAINNFYFQRLLLGSNSEPPVNISQTLLNLLNDTKRINELIALCTARNCDLSNYLPGLTWALLQWHLDVKGINEYDTLDAV